MTSLSMWEDRVTLHTVSYLSSVMFTAHISNLVKNLCFICTLEIVKKILAFKVYSSKT